MNALKFLRRKGELQKESEAIGLVQGDLLELIKERESLLSKFENIVPRTGDKSIATVDDVKGFSCVNGDVLTELLRNPKVVSRIMVIEFSFARTSMYIKKATA